MAVVTIAVVVELCSRSRSNKRSKRASGSPAVAVQGRNNKPPSHSWGRTANNDKTTSIRCCASGRSCRRRHRSRRSGGGRTDDRPRSGSSSSSSS
eukprot:6011572-Pyramimonas_sp.AAC.1